MRNTQPTKVKRMEDTKWEDLWRENHGNDELVTVVQSVRSVKALQTELNPLLEDLVDVVIATDDRIIADAIRRLHDMGLSGADYRRKINRMTRDRSVSHSEAKVNMLVDEHLGTGGMSKQEVYERTAAELGVHSATFEGAWQSVKRTYQKELRRRKSMKKPPTFEKSDRPIILE